MFRFHCLPKAAYLRKLCLRSVAWGLMVIFLGMVAQRPVSAGCHYGDSQFAKAIAAQDPHGHVRNFRFLGQLVYEGGDIKYVPWQATPRCQGPNCHADQPEQELTGVPTSDHQRLTGSTAWVTDQQLTIPESSLEWLAASDLSAFTGYPHEHEYPP